MPIEAGTEDDWLFDPFSGAVEDGYLLGRGALDNKSPVMATFEAIEKLLAEGHQPVRTLYYSLGHDEEIGGNKGAASIAKYLKDNGVSFEFMLGEGGLVIDSHPMLPDSRVVLVNLAQKGYLTLTLSTTGEGGHSSSPTEDNALARRFQEIIVDPTSMSETVEILKGLRKRYEDHHRVQITDDAIASAVDLSGRLP